jgi:hypothetical protein
VKAVINIIRKQLLHRDGEHRKLSLPFAIADGPNLLEYFIGKPSLLQLQRLRATLFRFFPRYKS